MCYKTLLALLFVMGVFCSYQILIFALVLENVPKKISGCVNTINMLSGLVYLPLIGFLLDTCWTGDTSMVPVFILPLLTTWPFNWGYRISAVKKIP